MNQQKLHVEVWSDVVCPFCYIGKRHYEQALAGFEFANDIELEFKSFQLDPEFKYDAEAAKLSHDERLAKKYGQSVANMKAMSDRITETAKAAGLEYKLDESKNFNTFDAHRILHLAKEKGVDHELEEVLFAGYFTEGIDYNQPENLKKAALQVGLTEDDVNEALTNDEYAYKVKQDIQEASSLGITGVPFFVFDRKYGVSGAQPVSVFLDTMKATHEEWKKNQKPAFKSVEGADGPSCDIDGNCD